MKGNPLFTHRASCVKSQSGFFTWETGSPPPAMASGLDRRPALVAGARDLDLAGLGLLRDRHGQPQDAGVVGRLDVVEVEVVAEHQLSAEPAARPLGGEHLPVAVARQALGA